MPGRVTYMNIPAVRGDKEESFEERRILDYVHAYQTTGRPPVPTPQQPTDARHRATLGYPPLFEPHSEVEGTSSSSGATSDMGSSSTTSVTDSAAPNFAAQAFSPTKLQDYGSVAHFHHISAQPEYSRYSVEELRAEAYKMGKKFANVPPVAQRPQLLPSISISATQSHATHSKDSLQSINSMTPYDQHSFEELRLAFVRAGRPLTSPEIIAQKAVLRIAV